MKTQVYRIGTRESPLAMWQAQFVQWLLKEAWPDDSFEIVGYKTRGDDHSISISKEGGKGLYVKELERALIADEVDLCVHSLKDLPASLPDGCVIGAIPERGEVRDVWISRDKSPFESIQDTMTIGTSSLRRKALLRSMGVKAKVSEIRGNIDTRLQKLKAGEYDAIILAAAGLLRLGLENEITEYLDWRTFTPAPGQGALAVEVRANDDELIQKLKRIHHEETASAVLAERSFLAALGGSCVLPLGAFCEIEQFQMKLHGFLADPEGEQVMIEKLVAPVGSGDALGKNLASRFRTYGADRILNRLSQKSDA